MGKEDAEEHSYGFTRRTILEAVSRGYLEYSVEFMDDWTTAIEMI